MRLKPPKAAANSSNTPSFPASYSQDDWDKDIASGKIPKGATFISYDSKTGIVNYNVPSTATVPDAIYTEINKSLTDPKQTMSGQISALNDAIENAGYWNNTLLGKTVYLGGQTFYVDAKGNILTQQDQVKIQWNNLTDTQKQTVAGLYSQDLYRTNPFSETTKQIAVAGQKGGIIGELATSPLTGITIPIAKAASGQHVTAQDIEGAVVTVVGDALMVGGGDAVVSGFGNAGKVIVNSLVTGMGTLGMVDTILQIKKGGTPGATIAVEAALSTAALIAGAGGLVSQLVPKDTPDIDVAQQFIDKMNTQTTPEGLAKNSPFQAPSNLSGDAEWGTAEGPTATPDEITKQVADVNSMQSQVKTLQGLLNDTGKSGDTIKVSDIQDKLDVATKQLDDAYNKLAKMQGTAGKPTATAGEITKQVADVNSMQSEVKTLQVILNDAGKSGDTVKVSDIQDKLDVATGQLDDADSELAGMRMGETAYRQAELTATYKEWVEASTKYAQNQYNINDLTAKIADNRATLDAITKGTTIPDEYLAKLASDTGSMEKTLAACQDTDAGLAKQVNDTTDRFKTTIQSYGSFAKGKGLVFDDSGAGEMLKNLPHNAADVIKSHIDMLMNGDNNPSAIATQEAKVNASQDQLDSTKSTDYEDLKDIKNELAKEQQKLAMMKVGSLSQAHADLVNAREELADVKDIMENGKLNDATKTNLLKIQNQLESQIADRESLLKTQLIKGEGTQDIIKIEDIKDSDGDVVGKRIYTNEGVKRYDIDDDGNIMWETGRDESSGGGKSPNTPTETRPSPDTTTPEETELQQTSRGMPKSAAAIVSAIGKPTVNIPTSKKLGEVSVPSTKTETTKVTTTQTPVTNPNKQSSKTEVVSPLTETNPAINPSTVHSAAQSKSQQQIQQQQQAQQAAISKSQNEAMDQNMDQSKNQNMQQNMNQQMQKAGATSTKVGTITDTDTNPPPENNDKTMPPADISKPNITKDAEGFVHVPQGSATWKQGFGYRTLVPPYDQNHFIFTMKPPKGAIVVPNAKSAQDTIQKLGKGNLPADMNVKMGIMTVDVKNPPNKPQKHSGSIAFKRMPVTNNAGSRSAPPHVARFGTGITRRNDR